MTIIWYDAGRGSGTTGEQANIFKWTVRNGNSIWRVRTIGPGASSYSGVRATFIIRLNDQT